MSKQLNIYRQEIKDIELFDDELCEIIQKYFVGGWLSKNNELFFDDEDIVESFNEASNILQDLIRKAQGKEEYND